MQNQVNDLPAPTPSLRPAMRQKLQKTMTVALTAALLAGCAQIDPPAVPTQPGKSFFAAREAVRQCRPEAIVSGKNSVTSGYIAGFIFGGLVLGPIVVANTEDEIRASGERRGADSCLEEAGYSRRVLTPEEMQILNESYGEYRMFVLDQLVAGEQVQRNPHWQR